MSTRKTVRRPLASLTGNPANAKEHDTDGIGASMDRFGMVDVIVLDDRTGYIVSGHGRVDTLRAKQAAGEAPPDGVRARAGDWQVDVVTGWASRDDQEAAEATVAVNRWTEQGGWDREKVLDQLQHLEATTGLAGVGFGRDDIDDLIAQIEEAAGGDDGDGWGDPERQVRALMLDYPIDDYRWLNETLARARTTEQVDSTAVLFLLLLTDDASR